MLVSLVTSPTALGEVAHTVPETLALDVDALQRLQNEVQAVVLTCGWLHACAQVAATAKPGTKPATALSAPQTEAIKDAISTELVSANRGDAAGEEEGFRRPLDRIADRIRAQLQGQLQAEGVSFGKNEERMFKLLVETMPAESNKLYGLMKGRVDGALRRLLREEGDEAAREARTWMARNNLQAVATDVEAVGGCLAPILRQNLLVHHQLYAALLAGASRGGGAAANAT